MLKSMELNQLKRPISLCIKCKMCTYGDWPENAELCPPYYKEGFFTYSGGGMLYTARALLQGLLEYTPEVADIIYQCTTCGNCDRICELIHIPSPHIGITDVVRVMRAEMVKKLGPVNAKLSKVRDNIINQGNAYGQVKELPEEGCSGDPEIILFAGCTASSSSPDLLSSVTRILNAAQVNFLYPREGICCGSPLYDLGFHDDLEQVIGRNVRAISKEKAKKIVFLCPHCYTFFMSHYAEEFSRQGVDLQLQLIGQYLSDLIHEGRLNLKSKKSDRKITYHDPCYLSRGLGQNEEVRKILGVISDAPVLEMKRTGPNSYCCGAGGGVVFSKPELASYAAGQRMAEAAETGADLLVTSCPLCKTNLERNGDLEVQDLTEVIASLL